MKIRRWTLLAVLLAAGCSGGTEKPGSTCPTLNDQGPAMEPTRAYLVVANSLGEDWIAARERALALSAEREQEKDLKLLADFDRALVEAGGWLGYADNRY